VSLPDLDNSTPPHTLKPNLGDQRTRVASARAPSRVTQNHTHTNRGKAANNTCAKRTPAKTVP